MQRHVHMSRQSLGSLTELPYLQGCVKVCHDNSQHVLHLRAYVQGVFGGFYVYDMELKKIVICNLYISWAVDCGEWDKQNILEKTWK